MVRAELAENMPTDMVSMIKSIKKGLKKSQIEVFIHGAQCTSISGRCYFSAEICGVQDYSANRGKCVQPCRRKWRVYDDENNEFLYDGFFFINAKDLCMIEHVPKLIDANIDAFKIEGRMRGPAYVDEVTSCYREAIDAFYDNTYSEDKVKIWLERLNRAYNRGFSTGFYFGLPTGSEIEREQSGNISDYKKVEIGRILSYYPEKNAAKIILHSDQLKLKDEVMIIGGNTNTYFKQIINSIQIKQKGNLTETPIATKEKQITVGIQVDQPVKKNDKVYKLKRMI